MKFNLLKDTRGFGGCIKGGIANNNI